MNQAKPPFLITADEAATLIANGRPLSIAGPEELLDQLPAGNWIGGTAYYFMTPSGGVHTRDRLMLTSLGSSDSVSFRAYSVENLDTLLSEAPANGYTRVIVPDRSQVLRSFAERSRFWPEIFLKPVIGWVSGFDLSTAVPGQSKVYLGATKQKSTELMVAAHVSLPANRVATIQAINIFEPDRSHLLRFPRTSFDVSECSIDGRPGRLSDFLAEHGDLDGRLPLVGDYAGAHINSSIKSVDRAGGKVQLYAPVFPDVDYHLALPVSDYAERFRRLIETYSKVSPSFSCNCILNYLHGNLEGHSTGDLNGPISFGEIGYVLHNQTLALLEIH